MSIEEMLNGWKGVVAIIVDFISDNLGMFIVNAMLSFSDLR